MATFDSIIGEAEEKFDLDGKGKNLLSILLAMISDKNNGGFAGFIEHFNKVGLGDTAASWISSDANTPLSYEQTESVFGTNTLTEISNEADLDYKTTTSAVAFMTPQVINELTPTGIAPKDIDLAGIIAGLSSIGAASASNVPAADIVENKENFADVSENREISASAFKDEKVVLDEKVSAVSTNYAEDLKTTDDGGGTPILKILLPLLLLALAVALGFMFCGKSEPVNISDQRVNANLNTGANNNLNTGEIIEPAAKTVEPSFIIKAENGKYIVSGIVGDEAAKNQIVEAMTAKFGAENVDFTNLKVDANAKDFAAGWWDNFSKLFPGLEGWKTGELSFSGNTISASNLPKAAADQLKTLFASGWKLPASIVGEESAAEQANLDAVTQLSEAKSPEQVVAALNLSVINFTSNSADIPESAKPILDKASEVLNKQPAATLIEIGGHTDSDGNDAANLKLSKERANAVRQALIERGVDERLLISKGYGETQPVAENDTPDNKFKNRRIEYKLITDKETIKQIKFGSNSDK